MTIRRATTADEAPLAKLWREFEGEVPEPAHRAEHGWEQAWQELAAFFESGLVLLAEGKDGPVGFAVAGFDGPQVCLLDVVYVRPHARRKGHARALIAEVSDWAKEQGASFMTLEVLTSNVDARAVYERLGFEEESQNLVIALDALDRRLARPELGRSFGSIHVQTDDVDAVVRSVRLYVPRLGHSAGSAVAQPRNGWVAVYDEMCDREPETLRRLAVEVSDRMGAVVLAIGIEHGVVVRYVLLERGLVLDEYASVPEYYGSLPPGDVIALGANPTVLARLTGADPTKVRDVARTASSPDELPPPPELLRLVAELIGIEGATYGYEASLKLPAIVSVAAEW